jgi:hypothetical protein
MRSHTAARHWIPPSWLSSTSATSYVLAQQSLAYALRLCVPKDTSRARFLTRQYHLSCPRFPLGFSSCALSCSTFTSLEYIEKAIIVLQGRLVTLMDLPTAAPYLFVPPAWDDAEARAMLDGISITEYQNVMRGTAARLGSTSPWDVQAIINTLHAENNAAGVKPARFMTALRHAMSGVKVRFLGTSSLVQI